MLVVKNKIISLLGAKLYFHVNSSRKNYIVLTPNVAALSHGCKPRIGMRLYRPTVYPYFALIS